MFIRDRVPVRLGRFGTRLILLSPHPANLVWGPHPRTRPALLHLSVFPCRSTERQLVEHLSRRDWTSHTL